MAVTVTLQMLKYIYFTKIVDQIYLLQTNVNNWKATKTYMYVICLTNHRLMLI